jgi:hypothetical protein
LPPLPTPNPPSTALTNIPTFREPQIKESTSSKPTIQQTPLAFTPTPAEANGKPLDVDNASVEELQDALKLRNLQYDELASFVLKMTEAHVAEVAMLEKKISTLTKDALKREKQIKGFTILLSDEESSPHYPKPLPPGILNQSRFASSRSAGVRTGIHPLLGDTSTITTNPLRRRG